VLDYLTIAGAMDASAVPLLKDLRLSTANEALNELPLDQLPFILELGDEKDTSKTHHST
jgi:hypothetical protein